MMPKVDTFEQDIATEIKRKEASLTGISAASNDVGNIPVADSPTKQPVFLIALIAFFILCLLGFGVLGYFYFKGNTPAPVAQETPLPTIPKVLSDMQALSPTLSDQIGRFVSKVEKKDQGYIVTITDYSAVFAYITRNETSYIDELALLFNGAPRIVATTTPVQNNATTTTTSSTTTSTNPATSTQKIATSTKATSTPPEVITPPTPTSPFYDITISNQNMRVWSKDGKTVVYAFVGNNTFLISNSKEGILALKSGILH